MVAVANRPSDLDQIGERVRALRLAAGLSQKELALSASVSQGWLSELEKGKGKRPSATHLAKLAAALRVGMSQLTLEAAPTFDALPPTLRQRIEALPPNVRPTFDELIERGSEVYSLLGHEAFLAGIEAALAVWERELRKKRGSPE